LEHRLGREGVDVEAMATAATAAMGQGGHHRGGDGDGRDGGSGL